MGAPNVPDLRVHLPAGLRRPRHAHRLDDGGQQRRPGHRRRGRVRQAQRHRAAGTARRLQGLLGAPPVAASGSCNSADTDGRDRPGGRGRRRRRSTTRSPARTTTFTNSVEVSFLFAAAAGVYVSASAGNSGPTAATVAHPSPWITTTAAGTHNRDGLGTVTIDGITYNGASSAASAVTGTLINALDAQIGAGGRQRRRYALPPRGRPRPGEGRGQDRRLRPRRQWPDRQEPRGQAGRRARDDPAQHLAELDQRRPPLRAVGPSAGHRLGRGARCTGDGGQDGDDLKGTLVYNAPAPFTASFSSRGPLAAGGGDILKPDIIAPGQDILAAVAPPGNHGRDFDLYSGTSMSSPHMTASARSCTRRIPTGRR